MARCPIKKRGDVPSVYAKSICGEVAKDKTRAEDVYRYLTAVSLVEKGRGIDELD